MPSLISVALGGCLFVCGSDTWGCISTYNKITVGYTCIPVVVDPVTMW